MELDFTRTAIVFAALIGVGVGALIAAPMMTRSTVLTMVMPSMIVFGLICLAIGVGHGRYRAAR